MRELMALAALLALGCGGAPSPALPPLPQVDVESFPKAARDEAVARLTRLRGAPENGQANGEAAMLLHAHGRLEPAAALYERAFDLAPSTLRWPYLLGVLRSEQGQPQAAVEAFDAALTIDPNFLPALRRAGLALLELGALDEANERFEQALALAPDDPETLYGAGRTLARSGVTAEAVARLERAVELAPAYRAARYELALAYRDLGREQDAARELARYEALPQGAAPPDDPLLAAVRGLRADPAARLNQARALDEQGRVDEAVAVLEDVLEQDPTFVQAHINLLILYGKTGRVEQAKRHYEQALELGSERAELHYNYGVLAARLGRNAEAETAFRQALEANPNHARSLHNLAQVAESKRQFAEAERLYRRALEAQPTYRLGHFHLGRLLLNLDRADEAIAEMRRAVKPYDAEAPLYLYGLAGAYARTGNRAAALEWGRKAIELARRHGQNDLAAAAERDLDRLQ